MSEAPSIFVAPASPTTSRSTIDPTSNMGSNSLSDGNLPPKDFTKFMPPHLPTPPFIFVPGVPNFRDMGGWPCPPPPSAHPSEVTNPSGATRWQFRRNLIFRCAHPTQLTQTGLMTLDALGVTDIFDLRSAPELKKLSAPEPDADTPFLTTHGHIELPGMTRHFTPVYAAEDYGPEALAKKLQWYTTAIAPGASFSSGFVNAYRDIGLYGARGGSYARILRQIIRSLEAETQREREAADFTAARQQRRGRPGLNSSSNRPVSVFAGLDGILGHLERFPSPGPADVADGAEKKAEEEKQQQQPPAVGASVDPGDGGEDIRRDGGVVFHCTAGKDRTGVLAAILQLLVGVDLEDVAWDYAVTEPGLGSWRRTFIERIARQGMGSGQNGKIESPVGGGDAGEDKKQQQVLSRAEAARICGSRAPNIRAFVKEVLEGEWGGVERYLVDYVGLSVDEVDKLRNGLVVKVPEDEGEEAVMQRKHIEGWSLDGGMEEDAYL
ncbi:uncharacterized protein HMPREF1541_05127 [Cyphellophora europaea CBS 101466]|uniref:Tyrosine specific protein phosphatases domain-containing protein n=1 Tax=Cyphellophora europaea (strain CBS 101466) TaxID=1220924 RepID=W2RWM1_CYPE1|nr:uncharacterized protein HMPREF1541_05127 [Cyphellophora europaea CBS 101466]ETN40847.1 hypothetical protein HMPREF1541_05127 [Cyphellophora europaea CBS 101466]